MALHYSWNVGNFELHIVSDNIINLNVESIVNSEQTDFILTGNQSSISGQIFSNFGSTVQPELDSKTKGRNQKLGKIIITRGGGGIKQIYHAGIHDPMIFLASDADSNQTEHLIIIRKCYRDILDNFFSSPLTSIAFPLLGTGLFHLDRKLVANEFFDQLLSIGQKHLNVTGKQIWLVDRNQHGAIVGLQTIIQRFVDLAIPIIPAKNIHFDLGLPLLDRFETKFSRATDPDWLSWLLVRYYEIMLDYLFFVLASAHQPIILPKDIFEPGKPISFGAYRTELIRVARDHQLTAEANSWVIHISNRICDNPQTRKIMDQINRDRNDIAHGRKSRELGEILDDIKVFLTLLDWKNSLTQYSYPPLYTLVPWVYVEQHTVDIDNGSDFKIGILEKWENKRYQYLIPYSGEVFSITG